MRARGSRWPEVAARLGLALVATLTWVDLAAASTHVPYGGAFLEEIRAEFFAVGPVEQGGQSGEGDPAARVRLDARKLAAYRAGIERKLAFVSDLVVKHERLDRGRSIKKARKRVDTRDTVIALRHVLALLDRMEGESDSVALQELAAEAWMVEFATRSHTDPIRSIDIPIHLWNMIFDWSMPNAQRARQAQREASNLVDPETGGYLTYEELRARMARGVDLSTLDPPDESPFWKAQPDIASVDVVENYLGGRVPVQHGAPAVFPPSDGAIFEFDEVHTTQTKPKVDVFWKDEACRARPPKAQDACKRSYKLKLGMETHADPTANALLAALGFNADLTVHRKRVKVYLGDASFDEVEKEWTSYFDVQRTHTYFPLVSVLLPGEEGRGRDERGEWIVFHAAVVEYSPDEIFRIGPWAFRHGMASTMREARALHLLNVWIANADMKDEDNNKLQLRKDGDGRLRMYLTQQDLGHSFGVVLPERVHAYPWEVIESSAFSRLFGWIRGRTELNYLNLQDSSLETIPTYADIKWMARRIAQLTRRQISAAVELGRWPGGVGPLYVEKLINRRNQIVEYFDLVDEYGLLPVDRTLTTADGSVVNGNLVQGRFPEESPIDYAHHYRAVFGPIFRWLGDAGVQIVQGAVSAADQIDAGSFEIENDVRIGPELLVRISRRVYPNPQPVARYDQYIVEDVVRLGFQLGIGRVSFVEGSWSKTLGVTFPVATRQMGIYADSFILPLLLPRDVRRGDLPERYVLFRESRGRLGSRTTTDTNFDFQASADAALGYVRSRRSVVDARGEAPIVYVDAPRFIEAESRASMRLWLFEIPFGRADALWGGSEGQAWVLDPEKLSLRGEDGEAIFDAIVQRGDFSQVATIARAGPRALSTRFRRSEAWLGAVLASLRTRVHHDRVTESDVEGTPVRDTFQTERRRRSAWTIVDNGETQALSTTGILDRLAVARGESGDPRIRMRWDVDDLNTHSDELDRYHAFLVALGGERDFVARGFRAQDWEISKERWGRWTRMLTSASLHLRAGALEAICRVAPAAMYASLQNAIDIDAPRLARAQRDLESPFLRDRQRVRSRLVGRERRLVLRADSTLRGLRRACAVEEPEARLARLVNVLYSANSGDIYTFDPTVIEALLDASGLDALLKEGQALLEGRIERAVDDQDNLPERRDLVGRLGKQKARIEASQYSLFPFDPVDQWNVLDWVRAAEARDGE